MEDSEYNSVSWDTGYNHILNEESPWNDPEPSADFFSVSAVQSVDNLDEHFGTTSLSSPVDDVHASFRTTQSTPQISSNTKAQSNSPRNQPSFEDITSLEWSTHQVPSSHETPSSSSKPLSHTSNATLRIKITDPRKEADGTSDAHISYLVTTTKPNSQKISLRRRFQDFNWLHTNLVKDYLGMIIPPLPGKHRMEYITGDRFGPDFVHKRMMSLERFINRVALHPLLNQSHYFKVFLEAEEWSSEYEEKQKKETVLDNFGELLLNAFTKLKQPDEKFELMKEEIVKFEENLLIIEKMCHKITKKNLELEQNYQDFGHSVLVLSTLESGITSQLVKFAETVHKYANYIREMSLRDETDLLSQLKEYIAFSQCVKTILKLRDQKQIDYEELVEYLTATQKERDKLKNSDGIGSISYFLKEKIDGLKGIPLEQSREEKITKLDFKAKELEEALEESHRESIVCSEAVDKEYSTFRKIKQHDLKLMFNQHADNQIEFYKKSIGVWDDIITILEEIQITD